MRIQHNIMAMNAYRNYGANTNALGKNLEKLSSGYKINRAGDDAAGLAISEKMRAQISGLKQAQSNVKDGISLVKTAEGALQEVQDMLNRMTTLATQSANGTYDNDVDRANLQKEVEALAKEIDRIADSSNFNGTKLLDGSLGGYNSTTNTTASAGVVDADAINVVGGNLKANDTINLKHAKDDGAISITGSFVLGGVTVDLSDDAKITAAGLEVEVISPEDADGNALASGSFTVNLTVKDKTKATAAVADAVGDGLTITIDTLGKPADDKTYNFVTDGTGGGLKLQIGDTADTYNQLKVEVGDMHTKALNIDTASINVKSQDAAADAIKKIKEAINTVSGTRGDLGAIQNRLEHTNNNLAIMTENIQDAESTIRDVDIADEMTAYTKNNILLQSAQAMLAQANQMPQGVLQLLQ